MIATGPFGQVDSSELLLLMRGKNVHRDASGFSKESTLLDCTTAQHAGRLRGDGGTVSYPLKGDEFKALCGQGL